MSTQTEILQEMKATLADLKVQVGRDMPQFDKLAAHIKALEQPGEHHGARAATVPEPTPTAASVLSKPSATATKPSGKK